MLAKANVPVFTHLLIPGEAIPMGLDRSDHVVETITIDVVDQHLGRRIGEVERMLDPDGIISQRSRLFPPAVFFKDVDASVSVDIATANPMGEALVLPFGRN